MVNAEIQIDNILFFTKPGQKIGTLIFDEQRSLYCRYSIEYIRTTEFNNKTYGRAEQNI